MLKMIQCHFVGFRFKLFEIVLVGKQPRPQTILVKQRINHIALTAIDQFDKIHHRSSGNNVVHIFGVNVDVTGVAKQ